MSGAERWKTSHLCYSDHSQTTRSLTRPHWPTTPWSDPSPPLPTSPARRLPHRPCRLGCAGRRQGRLGTGMQQVVFFGLNCNRWVTSSHPCHCCHSSPCPADCDTQALCFLTQYPVDYKLTTLCPNPGFAGAVNETIFNQCKEKRQQGIPQGPSILPTPHPPSPP